VTRITRRWKVALAAPAAAAVLCAAAYWALELAGASCYPDKVWGNCNTAADWQLLLLFLGAIAVSLTLVSSAIYGLFRLSRRRRRAAQ
jgi:hypothetical protein